MYKSEDDLIYEQEIIRDGSDSLKPWLAYITFKKSNGTLLEQAYVRTFGIFIKLSSNTHRYWREHARGYHAHINYGRW
jgi:hypothetical protein